MKEEVLKDILQWQHHLWKTPLLYWEEKVDWKKFDNNSKALEIGAREGGLSLWLALKNLDVICSDIQNPEIKASFLHKKYNLSNKITYTDIDATNIPYENYFDVIIMKSVLGGIGANNRQDRQIKTIEQVHKALKQGGYFLFAENAKASYLHQIFRKLKPWSKYWNYPKIEFLEYYLQQRFQIVEIKSFGYISAFITNTKLQKLILPIDKMFCKLLPSDSMHIVYGIARKS
ncbi:MAG: hypothetical protein KatS3mg027_1393 [Bacteroidia bacterium]|nr:MAG: hypothetical protein KatS3mg027_1393 [Bacteroidia bacterium]